MPATRTAKSAKRPKFRSKKPVDLVYYHLTCIEYNVIKRNYNEKNGTFYFGPDRNKINYLLAKLKHHADGLDKLSKQCVHLFKRPDTEFCGCKEVRKILVKDLNELVEQASKKFDDGLQAELNRCRQTVVDCVDACKVQAM